MTKKRFPVAALVGSPCSNAGSFQHWIMIDGFSVDVNPTTRGSVNVNLQFVDIVNPWPACPTHACRKPGMQGGIRSSVSGSEWYNKYWHVCGNLPGSKWNGKYLAVVQQPAQAQVPPGLAKAPQQQPEGNVISEEKAKDWAMAWISKLNLFEREPYKKLRGTSALNPLLVNKRYKGYYIVPLGNAANQKSEGAVIVNAYSGDFQEIGLFPERMEYLPEGQAVKIRCNGSTLDWAQLVFEYSEQTQSPFFPVWQISCGKQMVYVTMEGKKFERLKPLIPGQYPAQWGPAPKR